jgi:hypothetical protein
VQHNAGALHVLERPTSIPTIAAKRTRSSALTITETV